MDRRFVDHVLSTEIVTRAEMQRLILQARRERTGLVTQLLEESTVADDRVAEAVATYYDYPRLDTGRATVDPTAVKLISKEMARQHAVLPFALDDQGDTISIAVCDPEGSAEVVEMLQSATGHEPRIWISERDWLDAQIGHHYFGEELVLPTSTPSLQEASAQETVLAPSASEVGESNSKTSAGGRPPLPRPPVAGRAADATKRPATNPRGSALGRIKPVRKPAHEVTGPVDEHEELEQALEEFDEFLDRSHNFLGGDGPGEDEGFSLDDDASGFGAFDLFGEEAGLDESTSVEDKMARQEETVRQLVEELRRQRDIIQAMASLLEEKGILSKRDLKRRARGRS